MSPTGRPAELSGSIHQFSLPDIVQFLSVAEKTGKLHLTSPDGSGSIFFEKGVVTHAEVLDATGEEAFFDLMRWHDGQFEFSPGEASEKKSVQQHGAILLMEGARRSDEWGILSEEIPNTELIPEFVAPTEGDAGKQVTLNTSEWMVLAKIDGERSLKDLARESGLSDYHICRLLYPLLANGLIRLREPDS
jgi:hypothetical protein